MGDDASNLNLDFRIQSKMAISMTTLLGTMARAARTRLKSWKFDVQPPAGIMLGLAGIFMLCGIPGLSQQPAKELVEKTPAPAAPASPAARVFLVGDSHADHLRPVVQAWSDTNRGAVDLVFLLQTACPLFATSRPSLADIPSLIALRRTRRTTQLSLLL